MTTIDAMMPSKFLKTEILEEVLKNDGVTEKAVTIARIVLENTGTDEKPEQKPVMHFVGGKQGLIINQTNAAMLKTIFGTGEIDVWLGQRIKLWVDPSVTYMGKPSPGIRVRPMQGQPATNWVAPDEAPTDPAAPGGPLPQEVLDDPIGF